MTSRRAKLHEDNNFRLMKILEANPDLSQREMGKALGISFGGINYCLNALVAKGLVKIENFSQNQNKFGYVYLLTPSGIAEKAALTSTFLKRKIEEYEALKVEIAMLKSEIESKNTEKTIQKMTSIVPSNPVIASEARQSIPVLIPVVLCGGSGTRLWPLSRKSFPKQFVPLISNKSLLQLTLERVSLLSKSVICVASDEHRFLVAEAMQASKVQGTVLLEPVARNTAAAMAIAALLVKPEDLLLFCPSDHHIPDAATFALVVKQGVAAAKEGAIVTFGISPTFPSTAYGYIRQGGARPDGAFNVEGFTEKPAQDKAEALLLSGSALWNAGIFLCSSQTLLSALGQHAPDILQACQQAMASATQDGSFVRPQPQAFEACRSESIDYAVMEHHANVAVLPFASAWSDVGSWNAVADLTPADAQGNRIHGQGFALHAKNTFVHAPHRPVVVLGTQDLLIIDTPDALLVAASSHVEQVKQVVARLDADNISQSAQHRKVARPWGAYDSVDVGERHQVKRITVRPGAKLSLQMHYHRAEHWIVVKGTALVTKGEEEILLTENQSTYIPLGVKHRLENPGKTDLELIEVQSGSYLGEDDIVRFEDTYGRASAVESASNSVIVIASAVRQSIS